MNMNMMSMSNECERFNCSYVKILTPNARRIRKNKREKGKAGLNVKCLIVVMS